MVGRKCSHDLRIKRQWSESKTHSVLIMNGVNIISYIYIYFGDVSVAQLVASMSGVVLGGVVKVVGSNLTCTASGVVNISAS